MINDRCVLDLKGYGRMFRRHLMDMGLRRDVDPNGVISASDLDFAYNECTSQIVSAIGVDLQRFLIELNSMPDVRRLAHIPQFQAHPMTPSATVAHPALPVTGEMFLSKFKEYAMGLLHVISETIGIQADVDYLLEAVAEDYIIIMRAKRVLPHA